jgi:Bcr/CflA subfamily drug resistance transporter
MHTVRDRAKIPSLVLLICLLGFPQISETIYTPSLPDLARSLGIRMDLAEFTLSVYFIGFSFGVLFYGLLADVIGRRRSMLIGLGVYLLGSIGCHWSIAIQELLFFRFIQAFGAAAGSVVTQTMLRDIYIGSERGRVFSIVSGALAFSPAIGPVIGGVVDQYFGWRANFFVLVLMGILLGGVCVLCLPETRPVSHVKRNHLIEFVHLLMQMSRDPRIYTYTLLIAGCNGIVFSYYAEAPYIFIEILKLSPSQYGFLGLVIAASFFVASIVSLNLNRSVTSEKTVKIGALIATVGAILLKLLCKFFELSPTQSLLHWVFLLLCIMIIFIGIGVMLPNCLSHALVKYEAKSGSAGSLFGFSYYWLIAGFTAWMGILHNGTVHRMPLYFCGLTGGMLMVSVLGLREK